MIATSTYEDEPMNSPREVRLVLEAGFHFDAVPILLDQLIAILGTEKENSGGLTAIKESKEEYLAIRKALNPELDLGEIPQRAPPPITDFVNFLFCPNRNPPIIGNEETVPLTSLALFPVVPTKLKVTIYMGSGWNKDYPDLDNGSPPDLYVKLHLLGGISKAMSTKIIKKCWTPSWGEEFDFSICNTENEELLVEVYDHDTYKKDDFAGAHTLPVSKLSPGIRPVPLFRKDGRQCKEAFLLLRFMFV